MGDVSFSEFLNAYTLTEDIGNTTFSPSALGVDMDFVECIRTFGGQTFAHGAYRVFQGGQIEEYRYSLDRAFPGAKKRVVPFAYDWLGRFFAVDLDRKENSKPLLLLVEFGTGEVFEIDEPIIDFHNKSLVNLPDDSLALSFFKKWRNAHPEDIRPSECVGFKIPMFLGGSDELSNLEVIDLSVYVEICGQLRNQTRTMKQGQTIRSIAMVD